MNKAKKRQIVLKEMKKIYYKNIANRYDWMGYLITEDNKPSYHHITKREELIKDNKSIEATVENGAYLGKRSHELLHQIELIDHDLYVCWNDLFKAISNMRIYPIEDVWETIYKMREITEKTISEYKINKNRTK